MKQLSILFFLFIIISCKNEDKQPASSEKSFVSKKEEPAFSCFNGPDTIVVAGTTRGCHNSYFKLVNDSIVLQVEYKGEVQFDSCITIRIDSILRKGMGKLLMYENRKADFSYFCNDIGHAPDKELEAIGGTVYFRFYPADKTESGSHDYRVSIWIQDIEFWDDVREVKVEIDNILYYKVPNWTWYAG
jgi:hypothetical protein